MQSTMIEEMAQSISFVSGHDGTRIAVGQVGAGPVILKAGTWLSHLSHDLENPVWRHWVWEISKNHRLVRYDPRGCGLSDRNVSDVGFETWLSDLESVASAIEEPFTLLGLSQGCALSIAFALRHPEKVQQLVLVGSYAQGLLARDTGRKAQLEAQTLANLIELGWGQGLPAFDLVFTNLFVPDGTAEQRHWWKKLEQVSATPEMARRILDMLQHIDVLSELPKLDVPTLVFHARNDARVPFEQGRKLAALIPNARFVPLESANHILMEDEPAWTDFLHAFGAFMPVNGLSAQTGTLYGFTPAEAVVAELLAQGLSNHEIAVQLGKSEKTVRNQVSVALDKSGARSRAELVVRVLSKIGQSPHRN